MDTVSVRLSKYQRRLRLQTIVAATLLAEVTVFSAVKFAEGGGTRSSSSVILGPVFLSVVILAGVLLALARGRTEWQADLLVRYLSRTEGGLASSTGAKLNPDLSIQEAALVDGKISTSSPGAGNTPYVLALFVTLTAAGLLAWYVWLPVFTPAVHKEERQVEIVGLLMSIYFDVDRALVPESMRPHLEALGRRMAALPSGGLVLEGHADSDYRSDYNLELSRLRAEAVKRVLVDGGLEAGRITMMGYGETSPRAYEVSPAGKAQNRRVDITLVRPHNAVLEHGRPSP